MLPPNQRREEEPPETLSDHFSSRTDTVQEIMKMTVEIVNVLTRDRSSLRPALAILGPEGIEEGELVAAAAVAAPVSGSGERIPSAGAANPHHFQGSAVDVLTIAAAAAAAVADCPREELVQPRAPVLVAVVVAVAVAAAPPSLSAAAACPL